VSARVRIPRPTFRRKRTVAASQGSYAPFQSQAPFGVRTAQRQGHRRAESGRRIYGAAVGQVVEQVVRGSARREGSSKIGRGSRAGSNCGGRCMRSHLVGARLGVGVEHAVGEIVRDRCVRTDAIGKDKRGIAMISISPLRSCGWPSTIAEVLVLAAGPPHRSSQDRSLYLPQSLVR